jgi:hypothetical protein
MFAAGGVCGVPHPSGMRNSVEDAVSIPRVHPFGMRNSNDFAVSNIICIFALNILTPLPVGTARLG